MLHLATPGWAWEFLRRNPAYAKAVCDLKTDRSLLRRRPFLGTVHSHFEDRAKRWGLCFPESPDSAYGEAAVFWDPRQDPTVLPVTAVTVTPATRGEHVIDFRRLKIDVTVLRTSNDGQHVLLSEGPHAIQLHVLSGDVLDGPVRLSFKPEGMHVGKDQLTTLQRFAALRRSGTLNSKNVKPHANAERWLLALKMWPLLQQNTRLDHLRLARELFAQENVTHWTPETDWIRSRIRRAIDESESLVSEGYLDILNRGPKRNLSRGGARTRRK